MHARTGAAPVPGPMLAQSAGDLWGSRGDLDGAHLGAPSCAVRLRLHSVAPPSLAPHAAPNMAPPSLDSESLGSPTLDSPTTRSLIEQWMDSVGLAGVNAKLIEPDCLTDCAHCTLIGLPLGSGAPLIATDCH